MDNRGFPTGAPLGEGKGAFPYQAVNGVGGYPGMCYPGQEMVMPYGQYGATPPTDGHFNEQYAISQQVPQNAANVPYGLGSPAHHQYMQHYRQQAHIMQAAYSNAQYQSCVTNPQQIADSIYSMAAHAYNYQHHQPPQLPHAPNSYSPKSGGRNILSVRTGQSPANSIHSPAGSTHSMGERPMLSPHVQSNAQIYNYHQSNQQASSRHTTPQQQPPQQSQQQPQQPQQQHVPNMNYYSNNNTHPVAAVNGCMNAEIEHRRSVERLAAISQPTEQYGHNQKVTSPVHTHNKSQYYQQPPANKPPVTIGNVMAAPIAACQHRTEVPKHSRPQHQPNSINSELVASPINSNQPSLQSKPLNTVTSPGELKSVPKTVNADITSAPTLDSTSMSREVESLDEYMKPKEAAADSGIDSEQVDKDNDEENDTSTISNKSETSPQPHKAPDISADIETDGQVISAAMPLSNSISCREGGSGRSALQETVSDAALSDTNASVEKDLEAISPHTPRSTSTMEVEAEVKHTDDGECNELDHIDSNTMTERAEHALNSSPRESDLNESFSSQVSSSLCSSGASKQSMGDESRLPPRKRKQKLSEHTRSLKAAMPLKKRGRPSKEAMRLREAAKLTESQHVGSMPAKEGTGMVKESLPVKERKPSISSASKIKKPVHSGSLLHSPKLNLVAKDDTMTTALPLQQPEEKPETDTVGFLKVQSDLNAAVSLPLKSNAVLVSPPRKPKASVNEMEKALMRVVSSDGTCEVYLKKKRGRPPGSRNRKSRMLDQRARSNSASSTSKGQFKVMCAQSSPDLALEDGNEMMTSATTATNASTSTLSQSHKLSMSVQNRTKSLQYRKYKSVSPKSGTNTSELKLPIASDQWVCTFCQHISNYRDMGDLFGGYNIQPSTPVPAKVFSHRKSADIRQLYGDKSSRPNEIWFHERCIIWSPGVYMLAGKLYGVYEALTAAFLTTCSYCKKKGAILGCFCKGCSQRYHVHCADLAECTLNEENFSMLCAKHKDKKIVLM